MVDLNRCVKCKYLTTHDTEYPCNVCEHRVETKDLYEPRTNADHIRSMSDEELAGFLDEFDSVSGCDMCSIRGNCHAESNCIEGFLGWLKSEVKE